MSLDTLLLRLKQNPEVSRVSGVQPNTDALPDCNPNETPGPAGVATRGEQAAAATPATPPIPATGCRKTLENQACNPCNPCNPTKTQNLGVQGAGVGDLLSRLEQKADVSDVADVQPNTDAFSGCNATETADVSAVSPAVAQTASATSATSRYGDDVSPNPASILACTSETSATSRRRETGAALDPSLEDRIRAMARRWGYSSEELAWTLEYARRNPSEMLAAVEHDESWCREHPDRVPGRDEEPDPGRAHVVATLRSNPSLRRAIYADGKVRDGAVIVTVGVRYDGGIAVGDLKIPSDRFDPFRLLELVEKYGKEANYA